jgi:hypothetical protein
MLHNTELSTSIFSPVWINFITLKPQKTKRFRGVPMSDDKPKVPPFCRELCGHFKDDPESPKCHNPEGICCAAMLWFKNQDAFDIKSGAEQ